VPFGKPLVTEGKWGEFVPGAIKRIGNLTQILPDVLSLQVWTGYFFVSVQVRIDWRRVSWHSDSAACIRRVAASPREVVRFPSMKRGHSQQQEMTFVRMFRESNERSGPPAHVVVKIDSRWRL